MKTLSLKLDDKIFDEAEEITAKLHLARNRYINEAVVFIISLIKDDF
jgi:predicted transcriptional regulator